MAGEMFGAVIKYRGAVPKIALRERNRIYKESYAAVLTYWHRELRPKHFTLAGAAEYRYAPRSRKYEARKQRKVGHTRPLEFSGLSKALTSVRNVTSTSKGGRVRMNAPALNFKHPKSRVHARDELTRISVPEQILLRDMYDREVGQRFAALRTQESTTI